MNYFFRKMCVGLSLLMGLVSGANATYVNGNPLKYTDPTGLIVSADPSFQPTISGMVNNSPSFAAIYNTLNASTATYYVTPMSWTNPSTWWIPAPAAGTITGLGNYTIGIASDVTQYAYPGTDSQKHCFSMQRVLAHEFAHASGIRGQAPTINLENKIVNELVPNSVPRISSDDSIYSPNSCSCK